MSMELLDFLRETQADIREQVSSGAPFAEMVFSEIVMQHMAGAGMTFESVEVCHFKASNGRAIFRLSGYAMSEDADQLDLFVSLYSGADEVVHVPDSETSTAVEQCFRFLALCASGKAASKLDPSSDVYSLAMTINETYDSLEQIRIYVITDRVARAKNFKAKEIAGKTIKLEVMDIERLWRHTSEGRPREELVVDFAEVSGLPLPCVYVPGDAGEYDYILTAIPGEALRFMYEKYGQRLLEANVRSFLSVRAKGVNAGIQTTLRSTPERFMAYNNGLVMVVDEVKTDRLPNGTPGVLWLKGMQIVNGGQTTASIYFTRKRFPDTNLSRVQVPAKIILLKESDPAREEALISDISRFANSQNSVKQSDLSANKPFHVEVERLANSVFCPDGVGRWFYERATGSYNTLMASQGTTPAKLKALKNAIPPSRKLTKTDLAKYLVAWDGLPEVVSLGSQKCFDQFMSTMAPVDGDSAPVVPSVPEFKAMIAKAILFKAVQKLARDLFTAFQANIVAYTISMLAVRYGDMFDLGRVWDRQSVSPQLLAQVAIWAREVNDVLHGTADGRMVSEWAKKAECKQAVLGRRFSDPDPAIPELRLAR
jgi:hypothetical protein